MKNRFFRACKMLLPGEELVWYVKRNGTLARCIYRKGRGPYNRSVLFLSVHQNGETTHEKAYSL